MRTTNNYSVLYLFKWLSPFIKPYRVSILVNLFSIILMAINDIFVIYVANLMINAAISGDKQELKHSFYLMVISVLLGIVINFINVYSSGYYSTSVGRDIKIMIGEHIAKLRISYLESRHSGDFTNRLTNCITSIEQFLGSNFFRFLFHIIRLVVCISYMFYMNWQLSVFCFFLILIMSVLTIFISKPLGKYTSEIQHGLDRTHATVQDAINGITIIKSYNLAKYLHGNFKKILDKILGTSLRVEKTIALLSMMGVLVNMLPFVFFFLFGGIMVNHKLLTFGELIAFAQFIAYLAEGLNELPTEYSNCKITASLVTHINDFLDEKPERMDGIELTKYSLTVPALEFKKVSFSYGGDIKVLDNISFTLPQGKTIAIVGASGSGKTTIFKLISGFYDFQQGSIMLFNESLTNWKLQTARSMISLVSQDTFLFPISIAENISCSNKNYSMQDIEQAAMNANIHEFISSLPDGYDTLVGERGIKLSGGQRQRIAIARAILKDAPILLLDEATSALDNETEQLVQEAIDRIMKDKTVLVVAHRLSTIIKADQILVLNDGRIVERGTHDELLALNGVYSRLYNNQLKGSEGSTSSKGA